MIRIVIIALIVLINAVAVVMLVRDLKRHWAEQRAEPGNPVVQSIYMFIITFLGTMGVSDFALHTVAYVKTQWVELKKLPGTLNTQCLMFVAVSGVTYILSIEIQPALLVGFLGAQTLGTLFGVRLAHRINAGALKKVLAVSLVVAGVFILLNKLNLISTAGVATGLPAGKLILVCAAAFFMGVFKCVGVATFPPTMALMYVLGLNPLVAYPLMMGAGALSSPTAAIQFIKGGMYSRRMTLIGCTVGMVASLIGVNFVKGMDIAALQWIVLVVVFYAAFTMLVPKKEEKA